MTMTDESKFILVQFFLVDPTSEHPRIHPKKKEKRQGTIFRELDTLIREYESLEADIDIEPYKEAAKALRKVRGQEAYAAFVDELIRPYM